MELLKIKSLISTLNFRKIVLDNTDDVYSGIKLYMRLAYNTYYLSNLSTQKLDEVVSNFLISANKYSGIPYIISVDNQEVGWLYYYKDKDYLVIKNLYLDSKHQGVQIGPAILFSLARLYKLPIRFDILGNNMAANSSAIKLGALLLGHDSCTINDQSFTINIYTMEWQKMLDSLQDKLNPNLIVIAQQSLE